MKFLYLLLWEGGDNIAKFLNAIIKRVIIIDRQLHHTFASRYILIQNPFSDKSIGWRIVRITMVYSSFRYPFTG